MYRLTFVNKDDDDDDEVLAKKFFKCLHIRPPKHA